MKDIHESVTGRRQTQGDGARAADPDGLQERVRFSSL